jgi:hypothetical protein
MSFRFSNFAHRKSSETRRSASNNDGDKAGEDGYRRGEIGKYELSFGLMLKIIIGSSIQQLSRKNFVSLRLFFKIDII